MTTKQCTKCGEVKELSQFGKDKNIKDGHTRHCKLCLQKYRDSNREKTKEYHKKYYAENLDKIQAYKKVNRDRIAERDKAYKNANREKYKEYYARYSAENKDKIKVKNHTWYVNNKDMQNAKCRAYQKENRDKIKAYESTNKAKRASQASAPHRRFNSLLNCARYRNIPVEITLEQYTEMIKDRICYYCGESFEGASGGNLNRIESDEGYTLKNVRPCCRTCNSIMNNFSPAQLVKRTHPRVMTQIERSLNNKYALEGPDSFHPLFGPYRIYRVKEVYFKEYYGAEFHGHKYHTEVYTLKNNKELKICTIDGGFFTAYAFNKEKWNK